MIGQKSPDRLIDLHSIFNWDPTDCTYCIWEGTKQSPLFPFSHVNNDCAVNLNQLAVNVWPTDLCFSQLTVFIFSLFAHYSRREIQDNQSSLSPFCSSLAFLTWPGQKKFQLRVHSQTPCVNTRIRAKTNRFTISIPYPPTTFAFLKVLYFMICSNKLIVATWKKDSHSDSLILSCWYNGWMIT